MPEIAARSGFTRAHLVVVGVLVLVGVLLGGWAVLRAEPVPLPPAAAAPRPEHLSPSPTAPDASGSAAAPGRASTPAAGPSAAGGLVVHVLGAVKRPGLVELGAGARVQDAIEAAGGLRAGARLGDLNLAQALVDGQQLMIGQSADESELRGGAGSTSGTAPGTGGAAPPAAVLDLNTASVVELEALPGVGPVTAAKIVAWREEHGRFTRIEELQEVAGIGPKTYAELAPHVRV